MTQNHNLQSLPTEVFENIASFLRDDDLMSLRKVSRTCEQKSLKTFATACFGTLRIDLYPEPHKNIFQAIKIAKHPVFGKAVRRLEVVAAQIYCDKQDDRYQPQWQFLLGILFKHLKHHPGPHSISIEYGGMYYWRDPQDITYSVYTVLNAMRLADMTFEEFDMSKMSFTPLLESVSEGWHHHYPVEKDILSTFADAVQGTKRIKIATQGAPSDAVDFSAFTSTLASLPALKTLNLEVMFHKPTREGLERTNFWKYEDERVAKSVMQKVFPVLEELVFTGPSIDFADLVKFVDKQPTLTNLELNRVELLGAKHLTAEKSEEAEQRLWNSTSFRTMCFDKC